VLVLYYYEELTLKEIGEILDVTESRVCQIHTKAIMRLKGKIQRHEGKQSIGRLTAEIRRRRNVPADEATKEPVGTEASAATLESVDITACLALAPLAATLLSAMLGMPGV